MLRRPVRVTVFAAVVVVAILATRPAFHGSGDVWLALAPVLMMFGALLAGRYLGEETLCRWARERHPRRIVATRAVPAQRATWSLMPRGRLLLACSLAGRAPPACTFAA